MCYAIVVTSAEKLFEFINSHSGGNARKEEYYRPNADGTSVWMLSYLQKDAVNIVRSLYGGKHEQVESWLFKAKLSNNCLAVGNYSEEPFIASPADWRFNGTLGWQQ